MCVIVYIVFTMVLLNLEMCKRAADELAAAYERIPFREWQKLQMHLRCLSVEDYGKFIDHLNDKALRAYRRYMREELSGYGN